MNNYTIKDYLAYRDSLINRRTNKCEDFFLNDSMTHTVLVQTELIKEAMDSQEPLKVYCGRFSSFRSKAKNYIKDQKQLVEPKDNTAEYELWKKITPYEDLLDTLKNYLSKGGSMIVVLDEVLTGLANDRELWDVIGSFISNGQLKFYQLPSPSGLDHFTITGNSFRRESSANERTAICSFNHKDTTEILGQTFDILLSCSKLVNVA